MSIPTHLAFRLWPWKLPLPRGLAILGGEPKGAAAPGQGLLTSDGGKMCTVAVLLGLLLRRDTCSFQGPRP